MEDCLFCKIAHGSVPAYTVYSDDHVLAFLDIAPRAPGHTKVIPRVHAEDLAALPPGEIEPVFLAVQKVLRQLMASLNPAGVTIGVNQGSISGQTVPHLHIHLIPRFEGDGGGSVHSVVNNPPVEDLETMRQKIAFK